MNTVTTKVTEAVNSRLPISSCQSCGGSGYFDIHEDIEIERADGFFCEACLVGEPRDDMSPDPRYCQSCYEFLLKEAEMLRGTTKRPMWIPKPQKGRKRQYQVSSVGDRIMSTLENPKNEVDIIRRSVATRTLGKRGPKHKPLPEDVIRRLSAESMGSKAIVAKLKTELGIDISYKTIQRLLSGERKQLALPTAET